jgi:hypothetical protein
VHAHCHVLAGRGRPDLAVALLRLGYSSCSTCYRSLAGHGAPLPLMLCPTIAAAPQLLLAPRCATAALNRVCVGLAQPLATVVCSTRHATPAPARTRFIDPQWSVARAHLNRKLPATFWHDMDEPSHVCSFLLFPLSPWSPDPHLQFGRVESPRFNSPCTQIRSQVPQPPVPTPF